MHTGLANLRCSLSLRRKATTKKASRGDNLLPPAVTFCEEVDHSKDADVHVRLASVQQELEALREESAHQKHELLQHIELLQKEDFSPESSADCTAEAVFDGSGAIEKMVLAIQRADINATKFEAELNTFDKVQSEASAEPVRHSKLSQLLDGLFPHQQLQMLSDWLVASESDWSSHHTRASHLLEDFEASAYELAAMNADLEQETREHVSKLFDNEVNHVQLVETHVAHLHL